MKVVYTDRAIRSLEESLDFSLREQELSYEKVVELSNRLFNRAESLVLNAEKGRFEEYLLHLREGHRRLIEGHFKIIYKIEDETIYITDFFDSRQDPSKMIR